MDRRKVLKKIGYGSTALIVSPQILNILIGDISIVGPRPLIKKTFDLYDLDSREVISSMKPGLTGIGSIFFHSSYPQSLIFSL